MRKLLLLASLILACAPLSFAQTTDEYNKVEFYGGYSHNRVDTGLSDDDPDFRDIIDEREGFNGFETSITGNVHKYVGLKFDVSGAYRSENFALSNGATGDVDSSIYNFLGGVQLKDNRKEGGMLRPFAHFLAGAAHQRVEVNSPQLNALIGVNSFEAEDTSFALGIGGGLDIRVHPRVDIRAISLDYNPVFSGDQTIQGQTFDGRTQHNFRIGAGIVIH
ncbi:MAG TPA: outer membrane beta-barrel protein [Pyrinomonadaceae bacterium]|jgi:opacity protein-like surface antigen|nr:outer membrane beta-barrel protein [Pyrinomonadaceae bacterium]